MLKITSLQKELKEAPTKYCRLILTEDDSSWHRLVEVSDDILEYHMGVGKWSKVNARTFRTLARTIVQSAKSHQIEYLAFNFSTTKFPKLEEYGEEWLASTLVENLHLAHYSFTKYKSEPDTKKPLSEVLICGQTSEDAKKGFMRGQIIGEYTNKARDIANAPGMDMMPTDLGHEAIKLVKGLKVKVDVLGEKELKKLKMGALLAVGQGTKSETKFIIAEYWGAGKPTTKDTSKEKQPVILIGKGITYDSGGLNIKPTGAMHDMHLDMSGGSSVLATIACAAKLGIKKNIIVLVPAAENAISDDSMRAGDIITSMSGKTIEVLHTDAEGRMVMADALTYSERYNPQVIIDVATLTGASLVALGQRASAIMTKDTKLSQALQNYGEVSGDLVWPLPLWDEYKQNLKSYRADVSNISTSFSRFGGAIEAGTFLSFFVPKKVPWVHIDIAPRMESIPSDKLAKGSTGEPVRLLVAFLENY
jgi:leucyl aminopeptidase